MGLFISFVIFVIIQLFIMSFVFPLPISDTGTVRYRTLPWMTIILIIVNSMIFMAWQAVNLYQGLAAYEETGSIRMLDDYVRQIWTYGFRGTYLREGYSVGAFITFTSMFMHADMWHLLGNMIFLWTFGRRVEDACGPWRYLLFYLAAGMVANLGSTLLNPSQIDLPGVGASGAISGVMGAYLLLFPGALVNCLWGIGSILRVPVVGFGKAVGAASLRDAPVWRWTVRLPAWILLFYFLVRDLIPSLQVMQQGQDIGGVNNLAHLTGFLAALFIVLFVRKDLAMRFFSGRAV
jgi:membrane associated rhomboid family serine protease